MRRYPIDGNIELVREWTRVICAFAFLAGLPFGIRAGTSAELQLRVGLLSDVHIPAYDDNAANYYRKALEYFRDKEVDAVLVSGDLSINGTIAELEAGARVWYEVFPDDCLPNGQKVVRLFCTGNHDDDGWIYAYPENYRDIDDVKAKTFYFHRQETWHRLYHEDWSPVFLKEVKGYKFILRNWVGIGGTESRRKGISSGVQDESNPLPKWFAAHSGELPVDRPFFLVQHDPPTGGCNLRGVDASITDGGIADRMIGGFPNAVVLSGHSHFSIGIDQSISQDSFTSVNLGSLCGFGFCYDGRENGHGNLDYNQLPAPEMPPIDFHSCRQGLLMEVFADRICFVRLDFVTGKRFNGDWIVPVGTGSGRPYRSDVRSVKSLAPEFPADAEVGIRFLNDGANRKGERHSQVEVSFPTITGLDGKCDRAFDYEISAEFTIADLVVPRFTKRVFSPGCLLPPENDVGVSTCRFAVRDFPGNQRVRFAVTPLNEWGKRGKTLRSEWVSSKSFKR